MFRFLEKHLLNMGGSGAGGSTYPVADKEAAAALDNLYFP
jgi:hypothetical protein